MQVLVKMEVQAPRVGDRWPPSAGREGGALQLTMLRWELEVETGAQHQKRIQEGCEAASLSGKPGDGDRAMV